MWLGPSSGGDAAGDNAYAGGRAPSPPQSSQASASSPRRWSGPVAPVMHSILACAIANLESVCHFLNFRVLILWKSKILLPAFDL
jgi:hypothetical protein